MHVAKLKFQCNYAEYIKSSLSLNRILLLINITLRNTNYNFIMDVVAVPDLRAMLGVVKCPLREAFLH